MHSPCTLYPYISKVESISSSTETQGGGIISSALSRLGGFFTWKKEEKKEGGDPSEEDEAAKAEIAKLKAKRRKQRLETFNRILSTKLKRNDKIVKDLVEAKKVLKEISLEVKSGNKELGEVVGLLDSQQAELAQELEAVEFTRLEIENQFDKEVGGQ